jgi:hypothetical protein
MMLELSFNQFFSIIDLFRGDARCTIHCLPALGKIPQLQCTVCLCLYHHECAKKSNADIDKGTPFTCEVKFATSFRRLRTHLTHFVLLFRIAISSSLKHRKIRRLKSIISRHKRLKRLTILRKIRNRLFRLTAKSLSYLKRMQVME